MMAASSAAAGGFSAAAASRGTGCFVHVGGGSGAAAAKSGALPSAYTSFLQMCGQRPFVSWWADVTP
ncbi:hypothetical protein CYMTET_41502 [Cymbomonas tetramitiformis]|uniref:Uncharacterized protein n=1 Tax=Cymbomonas tetramitiformis TaxID=36881 RepID=A0AAE0F3J9_9CHLO|nr:hypothetical protein CYMTET_41502 [Cymbomonas tetramitiformis]